MGFENTRPNLVACGEHLRQKNEVGGLWKLRQHIGIVRKIGCYVTVNHPKLRHSYHQFVHIVY